MRCLFVHPLTCLAFVFLLGEILPATKAALVPRGAVWKYLDTGTDEGTAWKEPGFDDSGWKSGPARLGYGGDGEVTRIGYGPNANGKYITSYFRMAFDVPDPSAVGEATLNLLRDDGAIVYLNGKEIRRDNMPDGPVTYQTLATVTIGGTDEQTYFPSTLPGNALLPGRNVLAVEIHQVNATSSDISFDLELREPNRPPAIAISSPADQSAFSAGTNITLTVTASDPDGSIDHVEFWVDANLLGEATATPFSFKWTNLVEGQFSLSALAVDNEGASNRSAPVRVTVVDSNPPTLVSAAATASTVLISFSKSVNPASALDPANYAIDGGVQISGVSAGARPSSVLLNVSGLVVGVTYTLSVSGVQDLQGRPIAPGAQLRFNFLPYTTVAIGDAGRSSLTLSNGTYRITAGGAGVGTGSDQFYFAYQQVSGDFDYAVRLSSFSASNPWAKAGLMARTSLATNSPFAATLATPILAGAFFEARTTSGGNSALSGTAPVNYPSTWLRLRRAGAQVTGYASFDGRNWSQLGSAAGFTGPLYFGLAATSRSTNETAVVLVSDPLPAGGVVVPVLQLPGEPLGPSSRKTGLVISEIMYKDAPRTDGKVIEYIELFNSRPFREDMSGYRLSSAVDFVFPPGTILAPGGFMVVARSPEDVRSVYGISNVLGPYAGTLKSSGTVRLRSEVDAILLEVPYANEAPWPVAADGTGHSLVLARPSYGEGFAKAWDISDRVGGSPGVSEGYQPNPLRAVVINEFLAHTDEPLLDYIELYNHSAAAVDLSGCVLSDDPNANRYVMPVGTKIQANGFLVFDQSQLGFALGASGETIYFKTPNGDRVLDAVQFGAQENAVSMGRYPDGGSEFYRMQSRTPGTANSAILVSEVVINEIMYAPLSGNDSDQYVELYNAGAQAVDLGGWSLSAAINFTLPPNTTLSPNSYLVVAKDAAHLLTQYTNLSSASTLGDFEGKLSGRGERIVLRKPDQIVSTNKHGLVETNTIHITVDEVTWGTGGRWGHWAHGGGSSLELIDAHSNHRLAPNWADSDESGRAPWTTIEATGVLDNGGSYNGGPVLNIEVILLGEGECLLDDVEVHVGSDTVNLVSNSGFESGLAGWVAQGNHIRSSLETADGYNSHQSLHIRASSRGDTGANRLRCTLTSSPSPGQTVTIRAKARWIAGWPELLLRLHGNWLEAPGRLTVPGGLGTPGAANSRSVPNVGPAIYEVTHNPPVPGANEAVLVTAKIDDPQRLGAVQLHYRIDPQKSYTAVPMQDDGRGPDAIAGDGVYSVQIPGSPAGTLAAFYIDATNAGNASRSFPSDAPARECLVRFGDPQPITSFGVYRQWFTAAAISTWATRPVLSNERLDGTFVYGNARVIYNFGSRYAGSPYHQGFASPLSDGHYSMEFPADDLLLGTDNFNKVHAPGNGPFDDDTIQREQTGFWLVRQLGLPWLYRRYVAMYINGTRRGTLMEDTQVPGTEMIDEYFSNDADGYLFKLQPWFEFANSNARNMPMNNNSWCTLNRYLTTGGVQKLARYRWNYLVRTAQSSANDYSAVFDLINAANAPGNTGQAAGMETVVDMEQWMRTFAVEHAVGNWDSFGAQNEQNMYGYKPRLGKWTLFIWDYNIILGNSGSWGPGQNLFTINSPDSTMQRLCSNPPFRRAFWRTLEELCNGPMLASQINPILDEKYSIFRAERLNVTSPASIETWIASARTSILNQLHAAEAPALTLSTPNPVTSGSSLIQLAGEAPVTVKTITVNGVDYPVTWTSVRGWQLNVPVNAPSTTLLLEGWDAHGRPVPSASTTVVANYTGALAAPLELTVNGLEFSPDGTQLTLRWNGSAGHTYRIEYTTDLDAPTWVQLGADLAAQSDDVSVTLSLTKANQRFYRIVLVQ